MIVLVHGVPETSAVWDKFRRNLHQDSVAVSLPGLGGTLPAGFKATKVLPDAVILQLWSWWATDKTPSTRAGNRAL
jgi:pimeloyl-ACP methyl ester carboxylesterase